MTRFAVLLFSFKVSRKYVFLQGNEAKNKIWNAQLFCCLLIHYLLFLCHQIMTQLQNNSLHHTDKRILQLVIYIFLDSCWLYFATVEAFWMYNNNYVQDWTIRVNTFRKALLSINVKDWRVRYTLYYNILMIKTYYDTKC